MIKKVYLTLLLLLGVMATSLYPATPSKPNIILIMPDDIGYGDYACLGNPFTKTPSVDAFKKQSLLFTQFHVSPTCSPSRSALMSGRHEFMNGVTHTIMERERMSLATITVAQMLKTAGYTSGIFGKWHLGDEEAYRPENRGFDEVYIHGAGGIGQTFPGSCGDAPDNSNINPTLWHNGKFEKNTGYCTDLFFNQALRWMDEKRQAHQPFFAYITPNAAHSPHVVPEEDYQQYLGNPKVSKGAAKFYGMIENIDTNFGKLLQKLNEWGIENDTLVIYLGTDNGGTAGVSIFNAGMKGQKSSPYQGGTRSPAFFRWPSGGIPKNVECHALTSNIDIFPTLEEIAGVKPSEAIKQQVEGRSIVPLLKNPNAEWNERVLVHHVGRWSQGGASDSKYRKCAIQNSRFTLVENKELYDLKSDPGETRNVISQYPEVVKELRASYEQWWAKAQPMLINENVVGPKINPMKALYWKQFGGGPDQQLIQKMDPSTSTSRWATRKH